MTDAGLDPESLVGLATDEAVTAVEAAGMRANVVSGDVMPPFLGFNRITLIVRDGVVTQAYRA